MIIPAYNEEESIFDTVMSILNYRKKVDFDLDYVVINDGSTDNSGKLCDSLSKLNLPPYFDIILLGLIVISIVILAMHLFFGTELGQALIATGDNPKMATSLGISTKKMTTLGLMLSNSLIALTGAILSQNNGYADVNSGLGVIVVALAAIIIAEVIFTDVNFLTRLVCIVFGSMIYRLLLVFVLKLNVIQANDFKLVSALLIALFLSVPELKKFSLKLGKGDK